jgi:Flp pilus assembly CpaF family ATPase/Fe-S-cluster-containing hydrogenase component 2
MKKLRWSEEKCKAPECDYCTRVCPKGVLSIAGGELQYCTQCNPRYAVCMKACMNNALKVDKNGVIHVIPEKCDGCGACVSECKAGGIKLKRNKRGMKVSMKCDLCSSLKLSNPICVTFCPYGALEVYEVEEDISESKGEHEAEEFYEKRFEPHFIGEGKGIPTIRYREPLSPESIEKRFSAPFSFGILDFPPPNKKAKLIDEYGKVKIYEIDDLGRAYCISFPKLFSDDWKLAEYVKHFTIMKVADEYLSAFLTPPEYFDLETRAKSLNRVKLIARDIINRLEPTLDPEKKESIAEIVAVDTIGFGAIEYFWMRDKENLEEIEIDHPLREILVYHRRYGRCITNLRFTGDRSFKKVMNAILRPLGKSLDMIHPVVDAQLPDGSRLHAQISPAALTGATASIRLFGSDPWTYTKIMNVGTADAELGAFLWMAIELKTSQMIITGAPATGKTSLLSSLLVFIPAGERVISVEEEINELRFYDKFINWIPLIGVYKERKEEAMRKGEEVSRLRTSMDQITNSLRMRPDRIVLGELRGKEASELFSGANWGISFMTTLHSKEIGTAVVKRIHSPPMKVSTDVVSMLDIIITLSTDVEKRRRVIQCSELNWRSRGELPEEIEGMIQKDKIPPKIRAQLWKEGEEVGFLNKLYEFDPKRGELESVGEYPSKTLNKYAQTFDLSEEELRDEFKRRAHILDYLAKNGITNFFDVGKVIHAYYNTPKNKREEFIPTIKRILK